MRTINHKPHPNLPQGEGKKPKQRPHTSLFQEKERNYNPLKHSEYELPLLGEGWGGAFNPPTLWEDRVGAFNVYVPCLFLIVRVYGVVDGVVQTTAFLALYGHTGDEIARVDHIA